VTTMAGAPRRMVRVRVRPRAGKRAVAVSDSGDLIVSVLSPPEKGQANREVIELVARHFGLPVSRVKIVRGGGARLKLVELADR
jgi:uncharacterized protein (TIGR00251 family)